MSRQPVDTDLNRESLEYHARGPRPGKLEIRATKPMVTALDLSLAYSPGVAEPCRVIAQDQDRIFDYTNRSNLVAVVSNGTAVLGLGDIGPYASKPVMEGKAVLFKRFADIDVFDLEIDAKTPEEVIAVVKALEPTFGGINLEDIKAPDSFIIEETLKAEMNIPVFHDDQHGTAIISGAALLNALELVDKDIAKVRVVVSGAGAAAIACTKLWIALGATKANITMCDSKGVLSTKREITNPYKRLFLQDTDNVTLADALAGADVFLGLSVGGLVSPKMVASMADKPIVFALANPTPEISYPAAKGARPDAIMATGRSDYPNQVNNVLGFPFIFRGALDVRATSINEAMKVAAVRAIAALAREPVPASVSRAYDDEVFAYGPEYIIPKPFDPRVLLWVAPAVARAAVESGVARLPIQDWDAYHVNLERMMDPGRGLVRMMHDSARRAPKRIVFPEGSEPRVVKAASLLAREGIATPILMGLEEEVRETAAEAGVSLEGVEICYPRRHPNFDDVARDYLEVNQRKGMTLARAYSEVESRSRFAMMMLRRGEVDGCVVGADKAYAASLRPALKTIGSADHAVCGLTLVLTRNQPLFFADTAVNVDPDAEMLAKIVTLTVERVKAFDVEPRVAMLSFASFGAVDHPHASKMSDAMEIVRKAHPNLMIDGEVTIDAALDVDWASKMFPWSRLTKEANVFVFPNLASANIGYKLLHRLGGASVFGPVLLGLNKPVNVVPLAADAMDIVNLAAYTVVSAQESEPSLAVV